MVVADPFRRAQIYTRTDAFDWLSRRYVPCVARGTAGVKPRRHRQDLNCFWRLCCWIDLLCRLLVQRVSWMSLMFATEARRDAYAGMAHLWWLLRIHSDGPVAPKPRGYFGLRVIGAPVPPTHNYSQGMGWCKA